MISGWDLQLGGFQGGGFSALVGWLRFPEEEICDCKGGLLELDTSLAIATSGWRMSLLLRNKYAPFALHKLTQTSGESTKIKRENSKTTSRALIFERGMF